MTASSLYLLANHWRNIAGTAQETLRVMVEAGVTGHVVELASGAGNYAAMIASALEERARHLESAKVA